MPAVWERWILGILIGAMGFVFSMWIQNMGTAHQERISRLEGIVSVNSARLSVLETERRHLFEMQVTLQEQINEHRKRTEERDHK